MKKIIKFQCGTIKEHVYFTLPIRCVICPVCGSRGIAKEVSSKDEEVIVPPETDDDGNELLKVAQERGYSTS